MPDFETHPVGTAAELSRMADYHDHDGPMPAWAGWVWIAAVIFGAATWAAIAWGIWG